MKTVSIIGSFRKEEHYSKIIEIIQKLKFNCITILSPKGTEVVNSIDNFVIFSSDDPNLTPIEIEEATLQKIFSSDIVYVCDVDGYIGRTTAYEIGRCVMRNKEIYFMEYPLDFGMEDSLIKVLSVDELIDYITNNTKKQSTIIKKH